jgi:hypothetical protein
MMLADLSSFMGSVWFALLTGAVGFMAGAFLAKKGKI